MRVVRTFSPSFDIASGDGLEGGTKRFGRTLLKSKRRTSYTIFEKEALPHLDEIYRSARVMLGSARYEAEDLVQEVFAQAWSLFDSYNAETNCRAWLYAILTNKVRHTHRRMSRAQVISFSDHPDPDLAENIADAPPIATELDDQTILAALEKLTDEAREVILLVDTRGFAYREAAEILDVPVGTVMSRLSRARTQLRTDLATAAASIGIDTTGSDTATNDSSDDQPAKATET